ncbi:MAG: murein hydrolase activator EnvC family protein [Zhaonellaceae bacterium]|jgi:peptidoglycan hydrolase CwlO-like protein
MLKKASKQLLLLLVKRIFVGTILPAFLFCFCFAVPVLSLEHEDWKEGREEIIRQQDELKEQEILLLLEMRELQIKAEALKLQLKSLEEEIANHSRRINQLNKELAILSVDLATARLELAKVLKYYYYTGPNAYLEVIFTSQSWGDLLIRLEITKRLVEHNQKHIATVGMLEKKLASKKSELEKEKKAAEQAYEEQKVRSEMLAQAQLEKEKALAYAQDISQELYQKLVVLERSWSDVFPALDTLLRTIPKLPWFSLTPDKINFNWLTGQTLVEVSQSTINNHFSKLDAKWQSLNVTIGQDKLTLHSVEGSTIELTGGLVIENKKVRFKPESLVIDGLPVQEQTLNLLTQEYDLFLDLSQLQSGYTLQAIELRPQIMRFRVILE